MFQGFSWTKNTARGVLFLLRFNMYLFLAQCEQVYLFLAFVLFFTLDIRSIQQLLKMPK